MVILLIKNCNSGINHCLEILFEKGAQTYTELMKFKGFCFYKKFSSYALGKRLVKFDGGF